MKARKAYLISFVTAVLVFAVSMIYTFVSLHEDALIHSTVKTYKFLHGIKLFLHFLPAAIGTGCLIGWAIDFGKNAQGSLMRFSVAMFSRFQIVLLTALFFVFVLTAVNKIALPIINAQLNHYRALLSLLQEYNTMAEKLYETQRFGLAFDYAKKASEIDAENKETKRLLYLTEVSLQEQKEFSAEQKKKAGELTFNEDITHLTQSDMPERILGPYETRNLLESAREAYRQKDYFGAHYYAQTAILAAAPKDISVGELKEVAAAAWNELSRTRLADATEEQLLFQKKYEGYVSLIGGDYLKAYYIFKTLSLQSKKLSLDPDIVRYLDAAQRRIEKQYFFSDETFNLQSFESAENVHFRLVKDDGTTDVVFIKGITQAQGAAELAQYLRGLYIFTLDERNEYKSGIYTAYAKMESLSADYFDGRLAEVAEMAGKYKSVPYIILRSLDRNFEGTADAPELIGGYEAKLPSGSLILPMEYADFELIKEASSGFDAMRLGSLYRFVDCAEKYGYSAEIFAQILLNRLLYPLFILNMFIMLGWTAWHGRTPENVQFKFVWILLFPLAGIGIHYLYIVALGLFKLLNYGLIGLAGKSAALVSGLVLYSLLLIIFSVSFLSCRNSSQENK
ncbi:MAG: hypothetical protein ACTTKL_09335 [Treponema sp.]